MDDRINIQVQFKKAVWTCPSCSQEDIEDRPMNGRAEYVHTCSSCSVKFNQSGNNMKEYNGCINYGIDEYNHKVQEDIDKEKQTRCDAWLYEVKNPPTYVEPSKEVLEQLKAEKQAEVDKLQVQIDAKIEAEK